MNEKLVQSFEEYVNEGHIVLKRKYTNAHPEKKVGSKAPIREKILSFVAENGSVSKEQMMEFISGLNEESGGKTSRKWLNKNTHLVTVTEKNGTKTYSLTRMGKKLHEKIVKSANA
jgi:predicted transcriptional regulator